MKAAYKYIYIKFLNCSSKLVRQVDAATLASSAGGI